MRLPLLFLSVAAALPAELISFGVKGGLPLTEAFEVAGAQDVLYDASTRRYTVGPTVELHLPFGLGVEFDALYKRMSFESASDVATNVFRAATTADAWDFPLLLKVRLGGVLAKPYVSVGPTFRGLFSINRVENFFTGNQPQRRETDRPPELENRFSTGLTVAGGLELHPPVIEVSPEIRYTRWGWENFRSIGGALRSNQDQLEFLIGVTF